MPIGFCDLPFLLNVYTTTKTPRFFTCAGFVPGRGVHRTIFHEKGQNRLLLHSIQFVFWRLPTGREVDVLYNIRDRSYLQCSHVGEFWHGVGKELSTELEKSWESGWERVERERESGERVGVDFGEISFLKVISRCTQVGGGKEFGEICSPTLKNLTNVSHYR